MTSADDFASYSVPMTLSQEAGSDDKMIMWKSMLVIFAPELFAIAHLVWRLEMWVGKSLLSAKVVLWGLYCPPVIPAKLGQALPELCQAWVVFRGRSWQVGLAQAQQDWDQPWGLNFTSAEVGPGLDQDWGVLTVYCEKIMWDCTCNLTCEFKHHTNVTTCDITSFLQPTTTTTQQHCQQQPRHDANTNHNPWPPRHHNQPTNEDDCPQTKTAAHKWQQMLLPGSQIMARTHEQTWVATCPGEQAPSSSPHSLLIRNPGATSWTVMWQPNNERWPMLSFIVAVYFWHHGEHPPSHIHPNPLHWDTGQWRTDTGDIEPRWAKDAVQTCDEDNDLTVRCNDNTGKWGDDGAWRWQHVMMTWPGHRAEGTMTHDNQEMTMTHAD